MSSRRYDDLSKDELVRLLKARDRRDATRFGLVWEANEIERDRALNADFVALDLDPGLSCPGRGPKGAKKPIGPWKNLIIEGDNFDALRYLKMTFSGRVKCIYIDPPYNTGNKDFVYNDHYVDKEDLWRHSKWCEFMYQRLTLAKDLLRQDGIIFVSIDDNELFHAGLLMNRVFGEGNWISTLAWKKSYGGGAKANHVVGLHEYVLCYAQSKSQIPRITLAPDPDILKYYKGRDAKFDTRGPFRLQPLATNSMDERPNLRYPIHFNGEDIWPEKQWQWSRERTMSALADDELVIRKVKGKWSVNYKQYLKNEDGEERGSKPYSIIDGPYTQIGTGEVKQILGDGKAFSFPKPTGLVGHLLSFVALDDQESVVLDFFAGSGTTAHAIHKLNKEDGGNRRVILVSSTEATEDEPEKNICRDVCAERVRRVIEGYGAGDDAVEGLGGDFAYLRTRRIPVGELTEIDHAQVWTALQLIHCPALTVFDDTKSVLTAQTDPETGGVLIYVPHLTAKNTKALQNAVKEARAAILYTWQPDLARMRLKNATNVQIEAVPESLARRFGVRL